MDITNVCTIDLEEIAKHAGDLPALPNTAVTALELIGEGKASARDLQYVVSKDQALTARILKIVNSAMYCLSREVSTLSHAITILGFETVRSIIMAAAMQQALHGGKDLTSQLLWEHSWAAAGAAKAIAISTGYPSPDEAFTCGLLHDMGKLVLLKNRPERYGDIVSRVYKGAASFHEAELAAFGFSHAHLGALLARRWHFPPQLVDAIHHHHDRKPECGNLRLTAVTALANRMMIALEVGIEKDPSIRHEEEWPARYLGMTQAALKKKLEELRTSISVFTGATRT